jgi:protein-S-isoprenylcysteine O-methyltransferase Ste14
MRLSLVFLLIGIFLLVTLAAVTLWSVRRDYQEGEELSALSVALVWSLYLFHFAIELVAALNRHLPIEFAGRIFIVAGILMIAVGTAIYAIGILHLRSIRRMSGVDTSELITGGIYSWSRNPQNVGWILFLFGVAFVARSGLALLLAVFFTLVFVAYVPMEERHLESIYGERYREYKKNSHRYIGLPSNYEAK